MAQIYWVQKNKRKKNIFCLLNLAVLNLNRIFVNLRLQRSSAILESDVWCFSFPILEGAMVNYWLYFRFVKDEQLLLSIKARVVRFRLHWIKCSHGHLEFPCGRNVVPRPASQLISACLNVVPRQQPSLAWLLSALLCIPIELAWISLWVQFDQAQNSS